MTNLDFTSVEAKNFDPIPEGMYALEIVEAEEKTSSKGSQMIVVVFQEPESKTRIWENYVIQQNCLWKLKELLDVVGIDTSGSLDLDASELVGVMVRGKVIQDTYDDKITNRVKKVYAI